MTEEEIVEEINKLLVRCTFIEFGREFQVIKIREDDYVTEETMSRLGSLILALTVHRARAKKELEGSWWD